MTNAISTLLRLRFPPRLRTDGAGYFTAGHVQLRDLTETRAVATVLGTMKYRVELLDYRSLDAKLACTCPYSKGALPCKHLWAVLLAIDEVEAGITASEQRVRAAPAPALATAGATESAVGEDDDGFDVDDDHELFDDEEDEDDDEDDLPPPAAAPGTPSPGQPAKPSLASVPSFSGWQRRLAAVVPKTPAHASELPVIEYRVTKHDLEPPDVLRLQLSARYPKKDGQLGAPRTGNLARTVVDRLGAADRALLDMFAREQFDAFAFYGMSSARRDVPLRQPWCVPSHLLPVVLPNLAKVTRLLRTPAADERRGDVPFVADTAVPFEFELAMANRQQERVAVFGLFRRGEGVFPCEDLGPVQEHDVVLTKEALLRLECNGAVELARELAIGGPIELPSGELPALLASLARLPGARRFLAQLIEHVPMAPPVAVLLVTIPKASHDQLTARLQFDYEGSLVDRADEHPVLELAVGLRRRDAAAERAAHELLLGNGLQALGGGGYAFACERLAALTAALAAANVRVLAEGQRLRNFTFGSSDLTTGIDWFELGGKVEFGDFAAQLPELLRRPITPEGFVQLGDGSLGLLPQAWLRRLEAMRALGGEVVGDVVRLPKSRALLLDALLSAQEQSDVAVDAEFRRLRDRMAKFTQVTTVREPAAFAGELRPYQREGLGWLTFLREFGLGGCLADDMGLGKTVQVLAHLCAPRQAVVAKAKGKGKSSPAARRASVLVAPRSVLGNWLAEAKRFAPELRVLDFSAPDRWSGDADARLREHDLVLTTYALLRADAPQFVERKLTFHYAILDEAQAVKNPDSQSSKAVRLLAAQHRLVLTGTPVENHLGDLWSLFEFLNPGMLGRLPAFRALFGKEMAGSAMAQHRELVQRALRPVLLRRTKQQVLKDLPDKVEQTLWCELGPVQRKRYDALRVHYQKLLLGKTGELDDQQRFMVLEALLRLRQAACHEGLLPGGDAAAESAKFEELLPRLEELAAEGHKALVFSQFTSVLDLLEPKLRERGIDFERLDGKTTKRPEHVERFQSERNCAVFLISLKAGGFGLNLTAASYVFVLDPWWNPAAEMQAIDRAHRIGQKRVVNAYRLVCRGTVEERVLELQAQKKALCELILGNERSLLQDLKRADLELLLG